MNQPPDPKTLRTSNEQAKLDAAIGRADDLLIASLKQEERRRRWRRSKRFTLTIGGLVMGSAIVIAVALLLNATPEEKTKAAELSQRGWKLWNQRQFGDAETAFAEAARLDPRRADAWNGLGWSRFNSGKSKEAVEAFQKCVELETGHEGALNGLGQSAFMQRDYDKAEQYFLKAPTASAAWYGLARLYLLRGKFEEAEKYAQKIIGQVPTDEGAKRMLAAAKAKKLDDDFREEIEPPAPPKPGKPGELKAFSPETQEGWALFQQGKGEEAAKKFEAALKRNPDELAAHNGLGFCLINKGEAAEAKKHFEFYLKHDPNAGGPLNGLARCQMAEGKIDDAIATWEKMDKLPGLPATHAGTYGLAEAYQAKGDYAKAVKQLEKLVAAEPGNAELKEKLNEAKKKLGAPGRGSGGSAVNQNRFLAKTPVDSANLLQNPGFEDGGQSPAHWSQGAKIDGVNYFWDKKSGQKGKASLCLHKTAKRYFPIAQWYQIVDRKGDRSAIDVSAQVKAEKVTKAIIDVIFLDENDNAISHQWASYVGAKKDGDPPANHGWKEYSGRVEIPQGARKIQIALQIYGPGKVWFDEVRAAFAE